MARWYIIHAYSGFEGKVRDAIMSEATRMGLDRLVEAVEVPTETVTEARRGKKIQVERKFMPGYVLAKLDMNDDVYHLVKNTLSFERAILPADTLPGSLEPDFRLAAFLMR
jgi:transcription termination/antitermination protein NusG